MKKIWIIAIVIGIIGVAGFVMISSNKQQSAYVQEKQELKQTDKSMEEPLSSQTSPELKDTSASNNTSAKPNPIASSDAHFSGEADIGGNDVSVQQVVYNGTSFTPSSLTVKSGDIVVFKNQSSSSFWPASGPHPEHTDYPEFDPKKPIPAGQSFQFKFTKVGTWKYHDHMNSAARGTITVSQ